MRKKDGRRQINIRTRIFITKNRKKELLKTIDIPLLNEIAENVLSTESEFKNRHSGEYLKYRIPQVELQIRNSVNKIIEKEAALNTKTLTNQVYDTHIPKNNLDEKFINDDIQKLFGYPIPKEVWEELSTQAFIDENTGDNVTYEEFEDIAKSIEADFYTKQRKLEVAKMPVIDRYKNKEYDENNIFDCFGFCWSNHPKKNQPLIPASYKGLILRLNDYRFNKSPNEKIDSLNNEWIDDFLIYLAQNGYADVHPKKYTPFNIDKYKIKIINAERKPYRYNAFEKIVKQLKRYIILMQKYKIIAPTCINTKIIDADDFVKSKVNKESYTRTQHTLTIDEFKSLCMFEFNDSTLNTARDMFIIATLGGGFRGEEFWNDELSVEEINGQYFIHIYRSKTKQLETNPVFGELKQLIIKNNGALPKFLSYTEFRKCLKKMADILNFDRIIYTPNTFLDSEGGVIKDRLKDIFSIYFARKTFVNYLHELGMVDDDIIEFTTHSKVDTLKHYKNNLPMSSKINLLKKFDLLD